MNKKIGLIVDDEAELRDILFELFRQHYHIIQADNGKSALEILKKTPVDFVVSDIRMPGGDGLELLQKSLELPNRPLFILLTAFDVLSEEKALQLGSHALFHKPLDLQRLVTFIYSRLGR